jgi:ribosomal protein S18 acetylase RimI-like enzyme
MIDVGGGAAVVRTVGPEPSVHARAALPADSQSLTALVRDAYCHYVARIGGEPGPMGQDQAALIGRGGVTVLDDDGQLVGVIVLTSGDEGFLIENVAVHPARRGRGYGRWLLRYAEQEALRRGFDSLYLYTHRAMTENQDLYARLGYRTYDERAVDGAPLVFMRKGLDRTGPDGPS